MLTVEGIEKKTAVIGVVGMGYVGLPLALTYAEEGFKVIGYDIDKKKASSIKAGKTYIKHISSERIQDAVKKGMECTADFTRIPEADVLLVCVPTPLDDHLQPDLSFITGTAEQIGPYLKKGQLIVLESSSFPGTTEEIMRPVLEEKSGLTAHKDFHLAYSPEREDPNNPRYTTKNIPKVVGANSEKSLELAVALYEAALDEAVPVSSAEAAEATKIFENAFRGVNIALVNEIKVILDAMGIDVWEVIRAASTKPFGFMPFYPGPGLGGHCIPIDPFYLTYKAREFEIPTRFIELAGEINTNMPRWVVDKVMNALNERKKALNGSRVLIVGLAYKKNVDDMRESPSLRLIELLLEKGASVDYHDPYLPKVPRTRRYNYDMTSVELTPENISSYDAVLIATDHDNVDYDYLVKHAQLVVDTRNATKDIKEDRDKIVKA
ncbi:nucleotide sugar dehydrogenase [candidate division WOR-3 bacterium]|uniref:Nucleotide sugar dehydrogenase n=1 Tax=candidate division WOR-3 bacterium TaxID=2052148 RepID=A0A9D5QD07_UNCW3|nr:nucleotide sugar dehydrogenase [candidate division WOR-3 bacterium]MBD3365233.1 nucleotide sugar dehydrogenase [candidate division WOR-3 bacterium]